MIRDMDREGLLEEYEEAVQRQATLLKRQQAMIDSLQEELGAQQEHAVVSGRKQQARVEALLQQARTAALEEAGDEMRILRQERDTALKEKELSEAEGRRQAMEVQRLQQGSFNTTITTSGVATSTQPASQLEEDYQRVIQALEEETGRLRAEAEQAEEEKVAKVKINFEMKKEVTSLKLQLEEVRQVTEAVRQGAEESEREVREARGAMAALAAKQAQQEEDTRLLMAHVESLKKNKEHLEGVLHGASGRLHESRTRVAQSVRTAEDALREKDAALLREKHVKEEVRRLEATVGSVGEEAGRRAQEEMVKLRHQHNTSIKTLTHEMSRLEMALNQKQLECERAMSAVKRAEAEVERLETETGRAREEWRKEASVALLRITTLETKVHHLQAEVERWRQEAERSISEADGQRGDMRTRVEELEGRLAAAVEECAAARLEARRATKSATSHASHQAQTEREAASRLDDLKKQLRAKTEETEDISASARVRLEAADATHKEALKQVYQTMAALQDNYSRLQEQVNEERCEWEKRIADLGRQLDGCRKDGKWTMQGRREAETRLAVAQEEALQCKARIEEVEERLRAAERRFTSAKLDTIIKETVSNNNRETGSNNVNLVNS